MTLLGGVGSIGTGTIAELRQSVASDVATKHSSRREQFWLERRTTLLIAMIGHLANVCLDLFSHLKQNRCGPLVVDGLRQEPALLGPVSHVGNCVLAHTMQTDPS
jgi:hypothetical protein